MAPLKPESAASASQPLTSFSHLETTSASFLPSWRMASAALPTSVAVDAGSEDVGADVPHANKNNALRGISFFMWTLPFRCRFAAGFSPFNRAGVRGIGSALFRDFPYQYQFALISSDGWTAQGSALAPGSPSGVSTA